MPALNPEIAQAIVTQASEISQIASQQGFSALINLKMDDETIAALRRSAVLLKWAEGAQGAVGASLGACVNAVAEVIAAPYLEFDEQDMVSAVEPDGLALLEPAFAVLAQALSCL